MYRNSELTHIGLLAALITVTGAIKIPSLLPGLEFQLSAPIAVAICYAFGFRTYILAGVLASVIGLALGTQNLFNVAVQMQFRLVVGIVYLFWKRYRWSVILAGPLGTFIARITLSLVVGKAAYALILAAVPGMIFTAICAPLVTNLFIRAKKNIFLASE